jgi:hypothetical protein
MPTTHIAQWAEKYNIHTDKLYATDEREGGTLALGSDIPGFQREDLSVFTPEQWLTHKHELIFETWVDAARLSEPPQQCPPGKTVPEQAVADSGN